MARVQFRRGGDLLADVGGALNSTQFSPSAEAARLDWVRGSTPSPPSRARRLR